MVAELLRYLNGDIEKLAAILDCTPKKVRDIIKGRSSLTVPMVLNIAWFTQEPVENFPIFDEPVMTDEEMEEWWKLPNKILGCKESTD